MRIFLALTILITTYHTSWAISADQDTNVYSYVNEKGETSYIEIYDIEGLLGDELITWHRVGEKHISARPRPRDVTTNSYAVHFFVETDDAKGILVDADVSISFDEAYEQIVKTILNNQTYRRAFDYLPESCSEDVSAFIIITSSVMSTMKGYCLEKR